MKRSGVTLLETIIVIAILLVTAALLASAIQRVRSSAMKTSCSNNLRQIGLALQSYHGIHQRLPIGIRLETDALPFMGWQGPILPHLDQGDLWDRTKSAVANGVLWHENDFPPRSAFIATYACPADSFVGRRHDNAYGLGGSAVYNSYLGVAGWSLAKQAIEEEQPPKGVLYTDSKTRYSEITDGLSHTLLAGEKPVSPIRRHGTWYSGSSPGEAVIGVAEEIHHAWNSNPATAPCALPIVYQPSNRSECDDYHFWSYHSIGSNFLLVDGSVKFLRYTSVPIMLAISTRNGQESVRIED